MTRRLATLSAKKNDEQRLIRRLEEKAGIKSMEKWEETPSWPSSKPKSHSAAQPAPS
jgi:hypothetical protein